MSRILLLGGTTEALALATALTREPDLEVIYSLAGRTRTPSVPDCAIRRGGFGGTDGLIGYLRDNCIAALVDATHPYAARMAAHARAASDAADLPLFKFLRPAWNEPADAPWRHAATAADAARMIDGDFNRVFLSTGLQDIEAFSLLSDIWFLVRSIDPPDGPLNLAQHHHMAARGPFDLNAETTLLRDWSIDALVSKNSGGGATSAKLGAAHALDIPVVMIDRPPVPDGLFYSDLGTMRGAIRHQIG